MMEQIGKRWFPGEGAWIASARFGIFFQRLNIFRSSTGCTAIYSCTRFADGLLFCSFFHPKCFKNVSGTLSLRSLLLDFIGIKNGRNCRGLCVR